MKRFLVLQKNTLLFRVLFSIAFLAYFAFALPQITFQSPTLSDNATSEDCYSKFCKVSHIQGGASFDVLEINDTLYAAQGTGLIVYNVSNKPGLQNYTWRNYTYKIDLGDYVAQALWHSVSEPNYLYVATKGELHMLNISDRNRPSLISTYSPGLPTYDEIHDIETSGNYAYMTVEYKGVYVLNIENKSNITLSKIIDLTSANNNPFRLAISGNYLYVTMKSDYRLEIVDIANPLNPVRKGNYSDRVEAVATTYSSVAVKDNVAYVVEYHKGLRAINVTDPMNPANLSQILYADGQTFNAADVKIKGNYAYVSTRYEGYQIVNISNSSNISVVAKMSSGTSSYSEGIWTSENYTYVSMDTRGFDIYNSTFELTPEFVVNIKGNQPASVAVKGNYLYLGGQNDGIWVYDITNRSAPEEISFIYTNARTNDLFIQGDYLYSAGGWAPVSVINITDPRNPVLDTAKFGVYQVDYLFADGAYLYTTGPNDNNIYGFGAVDIINPKNLKQVYSNYSAGMMGEGRMAKYNNSTLLLSIQLPGNKGFRVINITNQNNPVPIATIDDGLQTYYGAVSVPDTTLAIAACADSIANGLCIINMSSVSNPRLMNKIPVDWSPKAVVLDKTNSIVYGSGNKVQSFNITNAAPIASYNLKIMSEDIDVDNDYVYVADMESGAYIFRTHAIPKNAYLNLLTYFYSDGTVSYASSTLGKTITGISATPASGSVSVLANRFNNSFANFSADATGNVIFTVNSLKPNTNYQVKKDGALKETVQADSFGKIVFSNSIW